MKRTKDEETQKRADRLLMYVIYGLLILITSVLIALVCKAGGMLIGQIFDGDTMTFSLSSLFTLQDIFSVLKSFIFLIVVAIAFVSSIPEIIRQIKSDQEKCSARDDVFWGKYFYYDKGIQNDMIHILRMMDCELYSRADEECVKLLQSCYVPKEQAAIFYCRMVCWEEMGYTRKAIEYGEKAISLRKGYMPALLKTAQLCIKLNKLTAAEQYLLEARELSTQDIQLSKMLYQYYAGNYNHEEALAAAMQWEELEPSSAEAAACVCRAAHKCGKSDIVNSRLQKCASEHYEGYAALKKEVRGY